MANKTGIAFIFPGQGSQYVGMGKDLVEAYPEVQGAFDEAAEVLGKDFLDLCINGPAEALNDTTNTQLCIYILSYGIYRVFEKGAVTSQVTAGHSLGEYTALTAAGVIKFSEGLRIVAKRAEMMSREAAKRPGTMLAVLGADMRTVEDVVNDLSGSGIISVANYNSPGQIVVSCETKLADLAQAELTRTGAKRVVALPVSGAFHSVIMADAERELNTFLDGFVFMSPRTPVVPNTLAKPVVDAAEIRKALQSQMSTGVKWQQSVEQMIGLGIGTFIEVGPGQVLSKIIKRIDKQVETIPTETPEQLAKALTAVEDR